MFEKMRKITIVLLVLCCFGCKKTTQVDTTPPTVTIIYPENNATVTIIADATDNKGITKVEFFIDDSLNYTDTSSPWEYLWDTNPLPDIFCTITAKAYDAEGNIGTSPEIFVWLSIIAETTGVKIYAYQIDKTQAGFELSDFTIIDLTNLNTSDYTTPTGKGDIMCERFEVIPGAGFRPWIDGINGGGVQNMGYMSDWSEADEAPTEGYASPGHSIEAIMGHVYAIETGDNHYAKIQITDIAGDGTWIEFKAAYQVDPGNAEF